MTQTHIVALGGSLLRPEEESGREKWFPDLLDMCAELQENGQHLGIVVGGGLPAREAIALANPFVVDVHALDEIGIAATRINATIIQQLLQVSGLDVATSIPHDCDRASALLGEHHFVVMGGTTPGHTTDAVAVAFARDAGARTCIIATNVSHVYDKDPREFDDAQSLTKLTIDELAEITGIGEPLAPGASAVIDPVAVGWAKDSCIDLAVLDGRQISTLEQALDGQPFDGTLITS